MRKPACQQGLNIRYGPPESSQTVASAVEMFLTTKEEKKKIGNPAAEPRESIKVWFLTYLGIRGLGLALLL